MACDDTVSSATRYIKGDLMRPYQAQLARRNLRLARMKYGTVFSQTMRVSLQALTRQFGFSMELGDVMLLDGSWYVTHSGLLRLATRKGCVGIRVQPVPGFCSPEQSRWAFRATAFKAATCKGSTVTETPIPETSQQWSAVQRCALRKRAQSIVRCVKRTGSAFAPSKRSGLSIPLQSLRQVQSGRFLNLRNGM